MAWLNLVAERRAQLSAIAQLRWHMFFNSLRTTRGKVELLSRIVIGAVFSIGAAGGAFGLGAGAWFFTSHHQLRQLALLLWPVFLFWQFFPVVVTTFTESSDPQDLLRFPLSFHSYFLVYLAYGLFDPATMVGSAWLFGILCGITLASPLLAPIAAIVLFVFAAANVLLTRMVFSWLERWMALRRTREILGILLFLLLLSFQFIAPLTERYSHIRQPEAVQIAHELNAVQRFLPPGLSAESIAAVAGGRLLASLGWLAALAGYGTVFLWLLNLRLAAQYRGETLSEVAVRKLSKDDPPQIKPGWNVRGVSGPVAAVFEKELRILSRSGPILLTAAMPPFMLLVIRAGHLRVAAESGRHFATWATSFAFPFGAAYSLLVLTNLVYNTFGADGNGIQFFLVAPVSFRQTLLGKNMAHTVFLLTDVVLVWMGASLLYSPPPLILTVVTLAGLLFAAPLNFLGGNLLSIYSPKRVDYGTFGRQRASQLTVLAGLGIQFVILGVVALTILAARLFGKLWIALPVFLLLGGMGLAAYFSVLNHLDAIAMTRREGLVTELGKA